MVLPLTVPAGRGYKATVWLAPACDPHALVTVTVSETVPLLPELNVNDVVVPPETTEPPVTLHA